jgi:DNA-binding NarL/FixJ family response regulator
MMNQVPDAEHYLDASGVSRTAVGSAPDSAGDGHRILVVDDHRSFADLLAAALDSVPGMVCVGTASTAAEALIKARELQPSIVIMDIQMPGQDGLQATRRIREAVPDALVAVVTAHRGHEWITRAAQAGASAFITKDGSLAELIETIANVRAGKMLIAQGAFPSPEPASGSSSARPVLVQRELDVLTYLGQGMQVKAIAKVLGITLQTCRSYIKSLHHKLGVSSQLEVVIKAQHLGLLESAENSSALPADASSLSAR